MVADGDSWQWPPERWLGFLASSHLCPGSGTLPATNPAIVAIGEQVEERAGIELSQVDDGVLSRWVPTWQRV